MKTNTFCYSLVLTSILSLIPAWALAAKAGDAPSNRPAFSKPVQVDNVNLIKPSTNNLPAVNKLTTPSVDIKAATRRPNTLPKVEPITGKGSATPSAPAAQSQGGVGGTIPMPAPVDLGNAAAIQNANQARQVKDMQGVLTNVPGAPERDSNIKPDLGIGGGSTTDWSKLPGHTPGGLEEAFAMPEPTTPVKKPANAAGDGLSGAPTGPMDPKGAMGGAASARTSDTPTSTRYSDRTVTTYFFRGADGSYTRQDATRRDDGTSSVRYRHYDKDGYHNPATDDTTFEHGPDTADGGGGGGGESKGKGFDKLQGTEGGSDSGAWARWMSKISGQRPDLSLKNPNRVNRGPEGGTTNPTAPRLVVPEDQLVINPDPNTINGQGAAPDARTAEMMRQQLKDKVKGPGFDPAGPEEQVEASEPSTQ